MIERIRHEMGYILCELSFRMCIDDKYFDDNLDFKPNTPLWIKFREWINWQLYHNGCWFYK
jgi:hypothetical protein